MRVMEAEIERRVEERLKEQSQTVQRQRAYTEPLHAAKQMRYADALLEQYPAYVFNSICRFFVYFIVHLG
jgi:hypothetical protein